MTPVELHGEPTVMSWVAIELDGSGDADRCGTENDRMIRVHPSSPVAHQRPTLEASGFLSAIMCSHPNPLPVGEGWGERALQRATYLPYANLLPEGEE